MHTRSLDAHSSVNDVASVWGERKKRIPNGCVRMAYNVTGAMERVGLWDVSLRQSLIGTRANVDHGEKNWARTVRAFSK